MHKFLPLVLLIIVLVGFFSYLPLKREVLYKLHLSGDNTTSCCDVNKILSQNGQFDNSASRAVFDGQAVGYPKDYLSGLQDNQTDTAVLGADNGDQKWIEVSLSEQKLRAWNGNTLVMEFPISSGKWAPTPTGTFRIWLKTRYQSMVGGSQELGTYYNLPNVPNNMFFYSGYALHGAYWHNNFGHPMSHGCVNEPLDKAAAIFDWAGPVVPPGQNAVRSTPDNPGTRVVIHS